jgi:OmpA-OmpF porin, OOP family
MKKIIFAMLLSGTALTGCAMHKAVIDQSETATHIATQAFKTGVNLQFSQNSSRIDTQYDGVLGRAADVLTKNSRLILQIQGHADSSGTNVMNNRLALARANSVRAALISNYGVNAEQLNTVGFGSATPIASNDTEEGRAENRRVTLLINGQ